MIFSNLFIVLFWFELITFLQGAGARIRSVNHVRHHPPDNHTTNIRSPTKESKGTLHVFVLAGQSNMEGHGDIDHKSNHVLSNGTLLYQLHDPRTRSEFQKLWDDEIDHWRSLPDVKIWFNEFGNQGGLKNGTTIPGINRKDYSAGDLTIGYGAHGTYHNNSIGPELGFGFNLEVPTGDKILIIKTAWGGTSLQNDWRPPSSTKKFDPYCQLPKCDSHIVGRSYERMMEDVQKLLRPGVLPQIYPNLAGFTPDIAGFGWFQGWNDGCSSNATAGYETNLVNLIQDLRRAWKKPKLPISIAISGFEGWRYQGQGRTPPDCWDGPNATKVNCHCDDRWDRQCNRANLILSQKGAANITKHPELECCVDAVETRDFWRPIEYSPSGQTFHFNHNSETYYLIGKAMALSMNNMVWEKIKDADDSSNPGVNNPRRIPQNDEAGRWFASSLMESAKDAIGRMRIDWSGA